MTQIGWIYADFFTGFTGLSIMRRVEKNPKDFLIREIDYVELTFRLKFVIIRG
jgi:hypothetical protein